MLTLSAAVLVVVMLTGFYFHERVTAARQVGEHFPEVFRGTDKRSPTTVEAATVVAIFYPRGIEPFLEN